MEFRIKKAKKFLRRTQWYVSLVSDNGNNLLHSETYNNFDDLKTMIDNVKRNAPVAIVKEVP